jgi:NADPH:quinone reductase-like Zn-dependent oxidoreductase
MQAIRVNQFGGPEALTLETVPRPEPGEGQVLIRVKAAGVGPWDAWVSAGRSVIHQSLPLTPGSDLSGVIERTGPGAADVAAGDSVFGVTNEHFTGAYAEYAVASAEMVARKPQRLGFVEAASVPVVACTAWQMVFDHGQVNRAKRVLVHGPAGNVGAFAVQLAKAAGGEVIATAFPRDAEYVRKLGADRVIDIQSSRFDDVLSGVDVVLDTIGGETLQRSFAVLAPGGVLVSSSAIPDPAAAERHRVRAVFFLVQVSSGLLKTIADLIDAGRLAASVGEVLPLADARLAHEMLAGRPHKRGKIVLAVDAPTAGSPIYR